jgi:hypothetical protein
LEVGGLAFDGNKENSAPRPRMQKHALFKKPELVKRKAPTRLLDLPLAPLFHVRVLWALPPQIFTLTFDQIFFILDHKDLLNLTRVNKSIRRALIDSKSKASNTLWRTKREESGAEAPPPGYTEAKWVSSLFMSECYVSRPGLVIRLYS